MNPGKISLIGILALMTGVLALGTASEPNQTETGRAAPSGPVALARAQTAHAPLAATTGTTRGETRFGIEPDRGDLVRYPISRVVRKEGPYTWHRANISEAHALKAIASGNMRVSTPDGRVLDFAYDRHVEHDDGSWTFVGRMRHGEAADSLVLTFGSQSAFGTIAQGRDQAPLRLSMRDGLSWLMETDTRALAQVDNPSTRPTSPDFVVPDYRNFPAASRSTGPSMAASQASSDSTTPQIIDLVVGHTNGYTEVMGGTSAALTRINNLVERTNQAYIDSQINARVRLVKAMEVIYTDRSDNPEALSDITGDVGELHAALLPLRDAREEYGADLVVLMRKFDPIYQGSCGVGWLLGGGLVPITPDTERFGYSVVSDGRGLDHAGNPSYCREDAFAHEIGHNLGAHHDKDTANAGGVISYGAFEYSFGHKTDTTQGNFYTIMSYNNTGQNNYAVFSNPRITFCGGLACGVEGVSDNARGMGQTAALIGSFRATIVPAAPTVPSGPTMTDCDGLVVVGGG